MNQAYINSYLHITPSTYGKKLSPLTVGHSLILDFISSPFFTGKPITEQDLKTALFFCSIDFKTGYEEMEVMNMPLTKAMCFVACQNNINGDSNLAGVDQSELLDDWEKEEKELNHE